MDTFVEPQTRESGSLRESDSEPRMNLIRRSRTRFTSFEPPGPCVVGQPARRACAAARPGRGRRRTGRAAMDTLF
jgi:hypothetical protein